MFIYSVLSFLVLYTGIYSYSLTKILNFIRDELTIEDVGFNEENRIMFSEISKFLTDEQTTNPYELLFYKAQKKNIVKFHSTHI